MDEKAGRLSFRVGCLSTKSWGLRRARWVGQRPCGRQPRTQWGATRVNGLVFPIDPRVKKTTRGGGGTLALQAQVSSSFITAIAMTIPTTKLPIATPTINPKFGLDAAFTTTLGGGLGSVEGVTGEGEEPR